MKRIILQKLLGKFHQDPTSQTLSRLHLSSKSLPGVLRMWRFLKNLETSETLSRLHLSSKSGVLEDMEVPDEPGGGVI